MNRTRNGVCVALILTMGVTITSAYGQEPKLKAGTLTCKGQGGVGLIVGSKEKLNCTYQPANGGQVRKFDGTITRVGLDIGIKGKSVIVWTILASTSQLPGESLRGQFTGIAADASLGLGAGAQVLVGGNNKGVVLQPLSVKGGTGVNVAMGVAGLTLTPR